MWHIYRLIEWLFGENDFRSLKALVVHGYGNIIGLGLMCALCIHRLYSLYNSASRRASPANQADLFLKFLTL